MTTLREVFKYAGFNSTGAERDGANILIANHSMKFYASHEQTFDQCPTHKHHTECRLAACKEPKTRGNTRRFAGFASYFDFLSLYKQWSKDNGRNHDWQTFYEMILGNAHQKPYFDLDYKGVTEQEAIDRVTAVRAVIAKVIPGVVLTFESHGADKFSYHLICRDAYVESAEHNKRLATLISQHLPAGSIDLAVYSSLQNFRLYDSTKRGKRRFKALSEADTALHYSDEIVKKFSEAQPVEQVRWFMIFRDSLVTMTAEAKLLAVPGTPARRRLTVIKAHGLSDTELKHVESLVPSNYKVKDWSGLIANLVPIDRSIDCPVCLRTHEHENSYLQIRGHRVFLYCRRAMATGVEPPYQCLNGSTPEATVAPAPALPSYVRPTLPLPSEDTVSVASSSTPIEGRIRWPGRVLDKKTLRHSAVYLVFAGFIEEQMCVEAMRAKTFSIKKIAWKTYSNGSDFTTVEMYFEARVERKVEGLFDINGQSPAEVRVLESGSRKFMLTEHLNALMNTDDEQLTNEDIMELVKHCQTESDVYRVAKEPRFNGTFLRIWKANNNEVKKMTKMVELCSNEKEVMELFPDFATASKAISIWRNTRKEGPTTEHTRETLFTWQLEWEGQLLGPGNKRHIKWIADDHGNVTNTGGDIGKSVFCEYMQATHPRDVCYCPHVSSIKDMSTAIESALQRGWSGKIILIDVARAAQSWDIYTVLEQLCNGSTTVAKYKSRFLYWKAEHVVVFANWYPKLDALSSDRWKLYTANDPEGTIKGQPRVGRLVTIAPVTYEHAATTRAQRQPVKVTLW